MTQPAHLPLRPLLLACCLAFAAPAALAAETTTSTTGSTGTTSGTTTATTTAVGISATAEAKLVQEFADFLGGDEQARAVVSGLRHGSAFDLSAESTTTGGSGTTTTTATTTIDPPTGTMGFGNVRITLRMAEAQLAQMGITQPTAEELSAVLLGGTINGTEMNGILALRADGMGWGQIAREYGMTVGQLMGKGAGLTRTAAATSATSTHAKANSGRSAQTSVARANGYIPSGAVKMTTAPQARSNGYIPSGKGSTAGLVTAGGDAGTTAQGHGKSHAAKGAAGGINVVANGASATAGGAAPGAGGSALAPGQLKKN